MEKDMKIQMLIADGKPHKMRACPDACIRIFGVYRWDLAESSKSHARLPSAIKSERDLPVSEGVQDSPDKLRSSYSIISK